MENKCNECKCVPSNDGIFWSHYINILLKNDIPEKKSKWYINWIVQFSCFMNMEYLELCTVCTVKDVNILGVVVGLLRKY